MILSEAYKDVFERPGGASMRIVLLDLSDFCYAHRTTNIAETCCGRAELEGRRQVWLRMQGMLELTPERIREIHREFEGVEL